MLTPGQVNVSIKMDKRFSITLNDIDLGQALDGLKVRAETWQKTADYLETGFTSDAFFIPEECTNSHEASRIADHYKHVIKEIDTQVSQQGGWKRHTGVTIRYKYYGRLFALTFVFNLPFFAPNPGMFRPERRSVSSFLRSRATLSINFRCQNSILLFGV